MGAKDGAKRWSRGGKARGCVKEKERGGDKSQPTFEAGGNSPPGVQPAHPETMDNPLASQPARKHRSFGHPSPRQGGGHTLLARDQTIPATTAHPGSPSLVSTATCAAFGLATSCWHCIILPPSSPSQAAALRNIPGHHKGRGRLKTD